MQAGISYTAIISNRDNVIEIARIVNCQHSKSKLRRAIIAPRDYCAAYRGGNTTVTASRLIKFRFKKYNVNMKRNVHNKSLRKC